MNIFVLLSMILGSLLIWENHKRKITETLIADLHLGILLNKLDPQELLNQVEKARNETCNCKNCKGDK